MRACESDRSSVSAQTDRDGEKCSSHNESDPESRRAQIPSRSKLCQGADRDAVMRVEVEGARRESHQTLHYQRTEMLTAQRNPLEDANREQG